MTKKKIFESINLGHYKRRRKKCSNQLNPGALQTTRKIFNQLNPGTIHLFKLRHTKL